MYFKWKHDLSEIILIQSLRKKHPTYICLIGELRVFFFEFLMATTHLHLQKVKHLWKWCHTLTESWDFTSTDTRLLPQTAWSKDILINSTLASSYFSNICVCGLRFCSCKGYGSAPWGVEKEISLCKIWFRASRGGAFLHRDVKMFSENYIISLN